MEEFSKIINKIENPENRLKFQEIIEHIIEKFPDLKREIKWNQPMFTKNGTFIISLTPYKKHFSIVPEASTVRKFSDEIERAGYRAKDMTIGIDWTDEVDFDLIYKMVEHQIEEKKDYKSFWRK
ncbi:DUF1801 domain-containing protein [Lagierella sp.]|uniref:iron chaperone n=1 Tax=Lagierella sp. TaxID=2849657 RepID=UPI00263715D9|nr:DUF1801 domain-containing protein [Lagierella sp.]